MTASFWFWLGYRVDLSLLFKDMVGLYKTFTKFVYSDKELANAGFEESKRRASS